MVWEKVGQEEHEGAVLLSFQVSVFRSRETQTREPTSTAGSRNRLVIETRRQERHPVFFEQMGAQEVGSEGNGKSRGKKSGKAMDVLRKLWCPQGQHTHMVWTKTKPEHLVPAEEDTTREKRKKKTEKTLQEYKNKWYECVKQYNHAEEQVE